jgi:hypothetical protein
MYRNALSLGARLLAAFILFAGLTAAVSAQGAQPPAEATIKRIYERYPDDGPGAFGEPKFVREVFSAPVAALLLREDSGLDFDPFVSGQDFKLTDLAITPKGSRGKTALVQATFKNMGKPTEISFELVRERGAWRITDIISNNAGDKWVLTKILRGK